MADPSPRPRRGNAPLVMLVAAPLVVLAFAYLGDLVFGSKLIILSNDPQYGLERFAVLTLACCAFVLIIGAIVLGRRRQMAAFAGLTLWLAVLSLLVLRFGMFQT